MCKSRLLTLKSKRSRIKGATLIEILVALLVLSLGVLGMAGLQARALKGNQSAMHRTQAVMMSYYILDAMRVDRNNAKTLAYNSDICNVDAITNSTLVDNNRRHWIQSLKATLGKAGDTTTCGAINCDSDGACQIQVRWDDSRAGGLEDQTITTNTRL
jgi:type IV pilus assembly protein PilV